MATLHGNGIDIEYEVTGNGEPLVLVMGLGGQLIMWPDDFVAELVDRGYRVVRFDNRDIGLSTMVDAPSPTRAALIRGQVKRPTNAPYLLSDMADDLAALLDGLDIDDAHIVGASMGGMIGQTLAIHHPARVRSLTSIMSNTGDRRRGMPSPRLLAKMARLMDPSPTVAVDQGVEGWRLISGPHFDEERVRIEVERSVARSFNPEGPARQTLAVMASPDRTDALGSVTAPTLVVHGLLDRLVKPSGGVATARAIPGSRLLMFPDMAHDMPRPRWPELLDAIDANCRRAPVATAA